MLYIAFINYLYNYFISYSYKCTILIISVMYKELLKCLKFTVVSMLPTKKIPSKNFNMNKYIFFKIGITNLKNINISTKNLTFNKNKLFNYTAQSNLNNCT